MSDRIPCRVTVETRKHLREQEEREQFAEKPEFDPFDKDLMHDLGGIYWEQLAPLLQTLHAIKVAERSFGHDAVQKAKGFDMLRPQLQALEDAFRKQMEEL